jgi:hypothetical protein
MFSYRGYPDDDHLNSPNKAIRSEKETRLEIREPVEAKTEREQRREEEAH